MNLANQIRALRVARDLTQAQVAEGLGVVPNTVSRRESATYEPSIDQIIQICRFFNIQPSSLFGPGERPNGTELLDIAALSLGQVLEAATTRKIWEPW